MQRVVKPSIGNTFVACLQHFEAKKPSKRSFGQEDGWLKLRFDGAVLSRY
jgi:hypothetical protein